MSFQLCLAYPKSTHASGAFRDLPELPPSLRYLNLSPDDSRGAELRSVAPPAAERLADFATHDSTTVVYNAAPGFNLEADTRVTFSADGLPKGVGIDKDTGRITGIVDHAASSGIEGHGSHGNAIYDIRITATDATGAETSRYFKWTVSNIEPDAKADFGATGEEGWVVGNVITGDGKGAEVTVEDGKYTVRPAAFGAGRDIDLDGDPLDVTMVAGNPANVGKPLTCPGGGVLTMHGDGDYSFRAPAASDDQPAGERPLLLAPYAVRDSEGAVDTAVLFLDQSNGAAAAVAAQSEAHVLASAEVVEAGVGDVVRARVARAADAETSDLRGLLDDSGNGDISSLLKPAQVAQAGAGTADASDAGARGPGIDAAGPGPAIAIGVDLVAVDYAAPSPAQADVATALTAELLQAGMVTASLS